MDRVKDMRRIGLDEIINGIETGNRGLIARAITLVESTKPAHREQAHDEQDQRHLDQRKAAHPVPSGMWRP